MYDAQGTVAQVEPHEVDQVFELYASQVGQTEMHMPMVTN